MDSVSASGVETPCDWPGESWPTLNATRGGPGAELHGARASVRARLSAEAVTAGGSYAAANPFRWSTKRFDPETGLSDFGLRYYSATLGRWLNRDPLGDLGGANVYAYVGNNPTNLTDYLGLASASCRPGEPCHSGLSSGGGGDPWSPEPTTVEEGDPRPCPHGNRDRGELGTYLPPVSIAQVIRMMEEHERRLLLIRLSHYERSMFAFGEPDLIRQWFETLKALTNRDNARFREIFHQFVDAWSRAHQAWLRNRVFPRVEVKRHIRGPLGWVDTGHNVIIIGSFGLAGAVVGDAFMDLIFVPAWAPRDKEIRGDWFFCTRRVIGICISLVAAHSDDFEQQE